MESTSLLHSPHIREEVWPQTESFKQQQEQVEDFKKQEAAQAIARALREVPDIEATVILGYN